MKIPDDDLSIRGILAKADLGASMKGRGRKHLGSAPSFGVSRANFGDMRTLDARCHRTFIPENTTLPELLDDSTTSAAAGLQWEFAACIVKQPVARPPAMTAASRATSYLAPGTLFRPQHTHEHTAKDCLICVHEM